MPAWVLDENVFKRSLAAPCSDAPLDLDAAKVLDFVQTRGKWVFTNPIREAYLSNWRGATCKTPLSVRRFRSFLESMWDSERHTLFGEVGIVDGRYHDDDEFIVSAAAAAGSGSILVTEDGRLRTRLVELGIAVEHGFSVVDIAGALAIQSNQAAGHRPA